MAEKNIHDMTAKEIWEEFYKCAPAMERKLAPDEALLDAVHGDGWCCKLTRRYSHIGYPAGINMRVHFCPRCGKYLGK